MITANANCSANYKRNRLKSILRIRGSDRLIVLRDIAPYSTRSSPCPHPGLAKRNYLLIQRAPAYTVAVFPQSPHAHALFAGSTPTVSKGRERSVPHDPLTTTSFEAQVARTKSTPELKRQLYLGLDLAHRPDWQSYMQKPPSPPYPELDIVNVNRLVVPIGQIRRLCAALLHAAPPHTLFAGSQKP